MTIGRFAVGRTLLMAVAGLVLLSICYLALGQAQTSAEAAAVGSDCVERTVDAGFFDAGRAGEPTVICATEALPSVPRQRTSSDAAGS